MSFKDQGQHTALVFSPSSPSLALRGLKKADVPLLVHALAHHDDYLSVLPSTLPPHVTIQPLPGKDLFVCAHAARDKRCHQCGPPLVGWLNEQKKEAKGREEIRVWPSSHVGGHVHAANVLVFPGGDWYGLVNEPEKAAAVLAGGGEGGPELKKLWRGRMGLNEIQQEELVGAGGKEKE